MTFKEFNLKIQKQFELMQQYYLFRLNITGQQIWDRYLTGFKPEQDPIFRDPNSSTHNCNNEKNFIRRYGNVVAIDENYNIISMFDVDVTDSIYEDTIEGLKHLIQTGKVVDVFLETFDELNSLPYEKCNKTQSKYQLGVAKTLKQYTQDEVDKFGVVNTQQVYEFNHFFVYLDGQFVDKSGSSIESIMGQYRDANSVFQRGLAEISLDTLILVKDLIIQGSLLNGDAHLSKVERFIEFKKEFDSASNKDNWCWANSYKLPIAKFRNELIGTLCVELTEGKELNEACKTWNMRVDPANYMKAKAPITANQIKQAQQFVEENGYTESFDRRFALLEDIDVSEIKHMNVDGKEVKPAGLFAGVQPATSTQHKRSQFDGIEEVSIEKFMNDILPTCTSIEAFMENRFDGNLVCLTTAKNKDSKPIFKWSNNYSWTYNGNLTGKSQLTQMVEAKGGRVDGVFRFTHSWNELEPNQSLMDLHVFMPGCKLPKQFEGGPNVTGRRVGWNKRNDPLSGGIQDVDYVDQAPVGYIPVENITFPTLSKMPDGEYHCMIHNWNFRGTGGRGKAEIAFQGELFQYEYPKTKNHEWITVAIVTLKDGQFTIEHKLPETHSSKNLWGLETNKFHKVNLVCLSPNHWGTNNIGNKHYFFMLDGCQSDQSMRSFHNENLIGELLEHRKVMEVLADTTRLSPAKMLAGLGFNATVDDELILKLSGSHKRTIKIKF